jgi:hypothetical protein
MTIKTLSAIAIVAAAFSTAAFAQDASTDAPVTHKPAHTRHFHNAYNYAAPRAGDDWLTENYGFDRSRPGDRDPDLNPAAN